jgi:hypothetical protein
MRNHDIINTRYLAISTWLNWEWGIELHRNYILINLGRIMIEIFP